MGVKIFIDPIQGKNSSTSIYIGGCNAIDRAYGVREVSHPLGIRLHWNLRPLVDVPLQVL